MVSSSGSNRRGGYDPAIAGLVAGILLMMSAAGVGFIWQASSLSTSVRELGEPPSKQQDKTTNQEPPSAIRQTAAAEIQASAAILQMAFNLFGLFGLGATIYYAHRAWKEAERSADAAHASIEDARRGAYEQSQHFEDQLKITAAAAKAAEIGAAANMALQRPWLSVDAKCQSMKIGEKDIHVGIQLSIENHGNSPAINIHSRPAVVFTKTPSRDIKGGALREAISGARSSAFSSVKRVAFPRRTCVHQYAVIIERSKLSLVAPQDGEGDTGRAIFYLGGTVTYDFNGGSGSTEYLYTIIQKTPDVPGVRYLAIRNANREFSEDDLELSENMDVVAT